MPRSPFKTLYHSVLTNSDAALRPEETAPLNSGHEMILFISGNVGTRNPVTGSCGGVSCSYNLLNAVPNSDIPRINWDGEQGYQNGGLPLRQYIENYLQTRFSNENYPRYGCLNYESRYLNGILRRTVKRLNVPECSGCPSLTSTFSEDQNYDAAVIELRRIFELLNTHFPFIKWANYDISGRDYWVPRLSASGSDSWACTSPSCLEAQEAHIEDRVLLYAPVAELSGWLAPSTYNRYRNAAFCSDYRVEDEGYSIGGVKVARKLRTFLKKPSLEVIPVVSHVYHGNGTRSRAPGYSCSGGVVLSPRGYEPDPTEYGNPYNANNPCTDEMSFFNGGSPCNPNSQNIRGDRSLYVNSGVDEFEFQKTKVEPIIDAGADGVYFWHWNFGDFSNSFSASPNTSQLFRRAGIRFRMMQENDFGFEPYTAPMPTENWRAQRSIIEPRMEEYISKLMNKRMDQFRKYADETYLKRTAKESTLITVKNLLEDKITNKTAAIPLINDPEKEFIGELPEDIDPETFEILDNDFMEIEDFNDENDTDDPT